MTADEIKIIVRCGETSTRQFKLLFKTAEDIANELVAFANSQGGSIFIGIDDKTGEIKGLNFQQIRDIGQLISAAAESRVHPAVYPIVETIPVDDKPVMIVSISKGADTPYTNNYRGLGSGIIRALKSDSDIEFRNEESGDQFRAILWRTKQNVEISDKTTLKTTQEIDFSKTPTQKITLGDEGLNKATPKTTLKTEVKQKTTQKILHLMEENPSISIEEMASSCSLTRDGVNWQIRKLKESGKIRRVGPDKGGHWEVCE